MQSCDITSVTEKDWPSFEFAGNLETYGIKSVLDDMIRELEHVRICRIKTSAMYKNE